MAEQPVITAQPVAGAMSVAAPKVGTRVELTGLKAKPELNGRNGVVIHQFDAKTGRCGIKLDDGTGLSVKPSNMVFDTPETKLERALAKLAAAGGTEDEDDDSRPPKDYLNELMAVGDARVELGQYDQAGSIFYRAYYASMGDPAVHSHESFPVAHKMLQAWMKSEDDHYLDMAYGMAQQTCMMPGCPAYIQDDMNEVANVIAQKGVKAGGKEACAGG